MTLGMAFDLEDEADRRTSGEGQVVALGASALGGMTYIQLALVAARVVDWRVASAEETVISCPCFLSLLAE